MAACRASVLTTTALAETATDGFGADLRSVDGATADCSAGGCARDTRSVVAAGLGPALRVVADAGSAGSGSVDAPSEGEGGTSTGGGEPGCGVSADPGPPDAPELAAGAVGAGAATVTGATGGV